MEVKTAVRVQSPEHRVDNELLLNEVFQLVDYNGKPSLLLWILLKQQPDFSSVNFEELIEKGVLNMEIAVKDIHRLISNPGKIDLKQIELQIYSSANDRVIQTLKSFQTDTIFKFHATLNADECYEAEQALTNAPSALHFKGIVIFQNLDQEVEVRFLVPFRKLITQKFSRLTRRDQEKCISIRYFDDYTVNYKDAPVFVTNRAVVSRAPVMAATAKLIHVKNELVNPALTVLPETSKFTMTSNPGAILNKKNKLWYINDIRIKTDSQSQKPSLPVINEDDNLIWPDSIDTKKLWYLPEYEVIRPLQTDSAVNSPFLLTFERIGSDMDGRPVLKGEVRISLSRKIPLVAENKLKSLAGSFLVPVEIQNETFALQIPFLDNEGKELTTDISPSEIITGNDTIQLGFQLTNDWIRSVYGVFSLENFQPVKSRIKIYRCFTGFGKVQKNDIKFLSPAAFMKLNLVNNASNSNAAAFNISNRTLTVGDEQFTYSDSSASRDTGSKFTGKFHLGSKAVIANTLVPKAGFQIPGKIESGDELTERSFGKEQTAEVFFSCVSFGQFYLESFTDGTATPIGCFEPYRIGEIKFRMFEEIVALTSPLYKVFQSLQSPDHFMVVPANYRITRFDISQSGKAFKACVHLYGAIEEENNFQNSLSVLDLSMEPDIPVYAFHILKLELQKLCNKSPVVEFPGEVMEESVFNWALPQGTKCNTVNFGRAVQLTLTCDIMEVLTLQAMLKNGVLNGQAVYSMADKSEFTVNLNPDTANITGPWETGPLEITTDISTVTFKNLTEKSIQLLKTVRVDSDEKELETILINKTLMSGESISISVGNTTGRFIPDCIVESKIADLDESWVFIDDLNCQVIFSTDIDFIQRKITGIDIEASFIEGPVKIYAGQLTSENPAVEFESFISLTKITGSRTISFRFRTIAAGGASGFSEWHQWSMKEQGNIINLTSDLLF